MRSFHRSLGVLGAVLTLGATPAPAQQPTCPDLDRLDQRIAALEANAALVPPPTPAELGALHALRQAAVQTGQAGNGDGCAALVHRGLAAAQSVEAPHAMTGADLERIKLYGGQGEDIGSLADVVVDPSSGRIAYAVVEMGGFLGIGERKVPVPWAAFATNPHGEGLVLNVPKERLKGAPQYGGSDRPDMNDRQWAMAVHTYYGVTPYWLQDAAVLPAGADTGAGGDAVNRLNQQVQQLGREVARLSQELVQARATPPATPDPGAGPGAGSSAGSSADVPAGSGASSGGAAVGGGAAGGAPSSGASSAPQQ